MTTQDIENFDTDVKAILVDWMKNEGFKHRKLTDTPTDDLQVVNKKYADGLSVWSKVSLTVLSADAALIVDTKTLTTTYDVYRITLAGLRDGTAVALGLSMRLNGDTASNYAWSYFDSYNATMDGGTGSGTSFGLTNGQTIPNNGLLSGQIIIGKPSTARAANILAELSGYNGADGRYPKYMTSGIWNNVSDAVNRIQIGWFTDSTTYWKTGSWCLIEGAKT